MYERRKHRPLPRAGFVRRLLLHGAGAAALILVSLLAGMAGYAGLEGLSWVDAFLNAAMLLGGMGPIYVPHTVAGKLFAGCYALYCGLVVLAAAGIALAPVAHLHTFHWEE